MIQPPPLTNDCFALPPGVHWTPVDEARRLLQAALRPVVAQGEIVALEAAFDRILSAPVVAQRSSPPSANSAVDGYGFAGPIPEGACILELMPGRAAAGVPFEGSVLPGCAVRILTGAVIPPGVDTVVLEEDCTITETQIAFNGPLKQGSNTRDAGEDMLEGTAVFQAGRRLTATDLALLASVGLATVPVCARLKVGVLSTGDEIRPAGAAASDWQVYDANRSMLLAMMRELGFDAVDLGLVEDTRDAVRHALNQGAKQCDVIFTSGGASAGDEDHVSAILKAEGALTSWRIALKPGRPLALGMWQETPIIGLPGNPVAAYVCALVFGRPALEVLAGGAWFEPQGYSVPAAFKKNKREGRNEYLRARLNLDGHCEVFPSEGSGRISSISWSDGLVVLGHDAVAVTPGVSVHYVPYRNYMRPS